MPYEVSKLTDKHGNTFWYCHRRGFSNVPVFGSIGSYQKANLPELEESVKRLIRMAAQKNAGQRGDSTCIDWSTLDMEFMRIAIEATALVLDDRFQELKEEWEDDCT